MICINKGQKNVIPLTLSETSRVSSAFYLLVFTLDVQENPVDILFATPDISGYPDRANIFELVEGDNGSKTEANGHEILPIGESHLNLSRGQYTYRVYESEEITLDIAETTGLVIETGRMSVQLDVDQVNDGGQSNNLNVYA